LKQLNAEKVDSHEDKEIAKTQESAESKPKKAVKNLSGPNNNFSKLGG